MCGIFGIYSFLNNDVASKIYYGLYALQHRGQEGSGIATFNGEKIHSHKGLGLVPEIYTNEILSELHGSVGIGHVRYSTTGDTCIENCQPFVVSSSVGSLSIVHNGDIVNSDKLKVQLEKLGHIFVSSTDSEVIAHLLVKELLKTNDIVEAIINISKELIGSYAIIIMHNNKLIAVRGPNGFKPLCVGKDEDGSMYVSSESCGLDVINAKLIRDVKPGEILVIDGNGMESYNMMPENKKLIPSSCMFEYVYFARPDSIIDGVNVYDVRRNIGKILAKEQPCDAEIVVPVPDSGITSAMGYSEEANIPYYEGLIKNRYVGRTFIIPSQEARVLAVRLKLNPIKHLIKDKKVVLIDDSIVRGTTSKRLIDLVKKAGAKEVHLRVGSPKITSPCFYGIDMPTKEELIGSSKTVEEIREYITADSLGYLSIDGLINAIGRNDLCFACLTGNYPTDVSNKLN